MELQKLLLDSFFKFQIGRINEIFFQQYLNCEKEYFLEKITIFQKLFKQRSKMQRSEFNFVEKKKLWYKAKSIFKKSHLKTLYDSYPLLKGDVDSLELKCWKYKMYKNVWCYKFYGVRS